MPRPLLRVTLPLILLLSLLSALPAQAEPLSYIVQPGDNLYRIGLRYGVDWRTIMTANGLRSPLIFAGQKLIIPETTQTGTPLPLPAPAELTAAPEGPATGGSDAPRLGAGTYTVVAGDTLWTIARRYGLTAYQLTALNPGVLPDHIYAGQVLRLPTRVEAGTVAPATETPAGGRI